MQWSSEKPWKKKEERVKNSRGKNINKGKQTQSNGKIGERTHKTKKIVQNNGKYKQNYEEKKINKKNKTKSIPLPLPLSFHPPSNLMEITAIVFLPISVRVPPWQSGSMRNADNMMSISPKRHISHLTETGGGGGGGGGAEAGAGEAL